MKKNIACILAAMVVGTVAFAQDSGKTWWNSYAPGIDQKIMINAGVGIGTVGSEVGYVGLDSAKSREESIIPLSVSADYKLPINLPITLGGTFIYSQWKESYQMEKDKEYEFKYNNIGFGVRGRYHFNFLKNLDVSAGLTLGYVVQTWDLDGYNGDFSEGKETGKDKERYENESFFLFGIDAGARYFFTKNIGIYVELGYSGLQIVSFGVAAKF